MLIVISPAKTLDLTKATDQQLSMPIFKKESEELVQVLQKNDSSQLMDLMKISPALAELNFQRYLFWNNNNTPKEQYAALLAFRGEVYRGIDVDNFSINDLDASTDYLRILSGLYGLLKPLDSIQAYRLEMGTKLKNNKGENLYSFWGDKITHALNSEFKNRKNKTLINLASIEYFKSINKKKLEAQIITPVFKEQNEGKYKTIAVYAKKARGLMCRFIIQNRLQNAEDIKAFSEEGYSFNNDLSKKQEWVFSR